MLRKNPPISALVAVSLLGLIPTANLLAQAPAVPSTYVSPAKLNAVFNAAEKAFGEKKYDEAVTKIEELLKMLNGNKDAPLELLYFNIGLAKLLGGKHSEAEDAFADCLKRYPKGEYASRCYLGAGRAMMLQDTDAKKEKALEALNIAALDPKYKSEAGLWLGQIYTDLKRPADALKVFKSLMGSDVRSPSQTSAAVEVIGLLAEAGKIEDLVLYLDRLINQSGVRDALAWYTNQVIVRGDELVGAKSYDAALTIYRSIPSRTEILATQKAALENRRGDVALLEKRVALEQEKPLMQRSNASELIGALKPAIELAESAMKVIEEKTDLDAALLMRRGRCLYYLDRNEEALVCFRTIRTKFSSATDAKAAAYAEIIIYSKLKDVEALKELCNAYLAKYPKSDNAEQVATLAGQVLVESGDWASVKTFYTKLLQDFPQSPSLDQFTFFQALGFFMEGDFKSALPILKEFLKKYPDSQYDETATYYVAMSYFLSNDYKETLASIKTYLSKYPDGKYSGDLRYRLAFIDFNDKGPSNDPQDIAKYEDTMSDKIIKDLTTFINEHEGDASLGSMLCLLGDTYKRKKSDKRDEQARFEKLAADSYIKAVWSGSPDDVIQYALDSATAILQANKDWDGIAKLHTEFLEKFPQSALYLTSVTWIVKVKVRENKAQEAADILANALKPRIGNPAVEQVEYLIDEFVKTLIPKKKPKDINIDDIDKQLVDILNNAIKGQENATTNARLYYARARLAELLKRRDKSDLYLKGIATINADNPSVLSPALLAVSGDILLKLGQLDKAEAMYRRLKDRYQDGLYADAGPVGLGKIALLRKQPAEALEIFESSMATNPGMSRFKDATLGKIEALVDLGRLEDAEKEALAIVGDKMFRGEPAGNAYILLGKIARKQAAKESDVEKRLELMKKAHAFYQRVYVSYQGYPEVCAEAYWQAYETLTDMGNKTLAEETLKTLKEHPKLTNTERMKKVIQEAK